MAVEDELADRRSLFADTKHRHNASAAATRPRHHDGRRATDRILAGRQVVGRGAVGFVDDGGKVAQTGVGEGNY
jgi:hypothetical protein